MTITKNKGGRPKGSGPPARLTQHLSVRVEPHIKHWLNQQPTGTHRQLIVDAYNKATRDKEIRP